MAHRSGEGIELLCRMHEEEELFAGSVATECEQEPLGTCDKCGEALRADGGCQLCNEDQVKDVSFASGALLAVLLLGFCAFGQTTYSGANVSSGYGLSGVMGSGAPLTYSARTDTCETGAESGCVSNPLCLSCTGTGQPLTYLGPTTPSTLPVAGPVGSVTCGSLGTITQPSNGQYLCGMNTVTTDPDFGTKMVRATDYSMPAQGVSFNLGSAGTPHLWSADSKKLIAQNTGSASLILSFSADPNPQSSTYMQVAPTDLYGGNVFPGGNPLAFSFVTPNLLWELDNEQASTVSGSVTSGTFASRETVHQCSPAPCSTGPYATLVTVNPNSIQIGSISGGTANASTTWVGQTSNAVFTPSSAPTTLAYINQLNKVIIADSGNPSAWTLARSKLFNFNWDGSTDGTSSQNCLPADYKTNWTGLFVPSYDDTSFTIAWSDDGQDGQPGGSCSHSAGGVCTGGIYVTNFTVGKGGCRMLNTLSGQITGDWGPTGYATNGQATDGNGNPLLDGSTVTFQDYDNLHEGFNMPNASYAALGYVEQAKGQLSSVQSDGNGDTTVTLNNRTKYPAGQLVYFYGLQNSSNTWLNCTPTARPCTSAPWMVTQGTSNQQIVINDRVNGVPHAAGGPYAEPQPSNTTSTVAGLCFDSLNYSAICGTYYWHVPTLTIEPCLQGDCQGHAAEAYVNSYRGKYYTAHTVANPSLPCSISPAVPCPSADEFQLLPLSIPDDQHGMPNNAGTQDLSPVGMITTLVCGQAPPGGGAFGCPPTSSHSYTIWNDEIIAIENWIVRAPAGADCNYSAVGGPSGNTGCVYRLGHTFNTGDHWNFNTQNGIGNISPDGNWTAFPSTMGNTLGCTDGSTNCWSSYIASGPPTASMAGATIQTDASSHLTVTMTNQFCPPGGNQYYWVSGAVETISCGSAPEQVTLSGFAESWANGTFTITAVNGCDSLDQNAGNCTSFAVTGSGIPANYGPVTESSGTQKAASPTNCNNGTPCQRADIWIAYLPSAHQ